MRRSLAGKSLLRNASRGEKTFFLVLAAFFVLIGPAQFFAPYDFAQQAVTAIANSKPYQGDGIVVAVDEATVDADSDGTWTNADLAGLLSRIAQGEPSQVVIESHDLSEEALSNIDRLSEAFEQFPNRPIWQIETPSDGLEQLYGERSVDDVRSGRPYSREAGTDFGERVVPAMMPLKRALLPAPLKTAFVVETDTGLYPTTANLLAQGAKPRTNVFRIDLSYDPDTVPQISAAEVLGDDFDTKRLAGKQIVVALEINAARKDYATPQNFHTSSAVAALMAAQTLQDGPPLSLGWVPGLILALAGGAAWFFLEKPVGRQIAVVALLILVVSPFFLEQKRIYLDASNGIAFIGFLFLGKVWQKSGRAVRTYRDAAETKSRFLAQASHDLRQPIHAIGLLADRLEQTKLTAEQGDLVNKISWSVDNASRMFRSLLDIAAIESGALQVNKGPVSVNDLLAEVDSQNSLAAEQASVDIRLVPCDLAVHTDRALVGTMIQNLVSNAIKYSPGQRVIVGCRRQRNTLSLHVIDSGQGISKADLKMVKKEFYRSSRTSLLRGDNKGLGLAIVSRLAGLLDLKFELRSEQGKGTIAIVGGLRILDDPTLEKQPRRGDTNRPLAGLSVHIAEDDADTLEAMRTLLEAWGCHVTSSTSFPKDPFDDQILLTDFDFGKTGSLKDHQHALNELGASGVQIAIISGHHPEQIRSQAPSFSGPILSKPLRAAELRSVLMAFRAEIASGGPASTS